MLTYYIWIQIMFYLCCPLLPSHSPPVLYFPCHFMFFSLCITFPPTALMLSCYNFQFSPCPLFWERELDLVISTAALSLYIILSFFHLPLCWKNSLLPLVLIKYISRPLSSQILSGVLLEVLSEDFPEFFPTEVQMVWTKLLGAVYWHVTGAYTDVGWLQVSSSAVWRFWKKRG